jgi:hypothetical protein
MIQVVDNYRAQIFDEAEAAMLHYAQFDVNDFAVPLDCLINNISEILLFERHAADISNGEKFPEKLVVFRSNVPFDDMSGNGESFSMPLPKEKQEKFQEAFNQVRKDAILIVSGHGMPAVIDISRADIFNAQSQRIRMLREQIANVFGASNAEMNLTGTESTNGRNTSQTQERKDREKGIYPHIKSIENLFNYDIIADRYSDAWLFSFETSLSQAEQIELWRNKVQSGVFSVNEMRTMDVGIDAFDDKQFDLPQGAQSGGQEGIPGGQNAQEAPGGNPEGPEQMQALTQALGGGQ